jgi:FdhD protein
MDGGSRSVRVVRLDGRTARTARDRIAVEEPLEIRAAGPGQDPVQVAVTMRTPGNDFDLAAGFLFTEGLVADADEIAAIKYCTDVGPEEQAYNIVTVHLRRPFDPGSLQRNFYATSSCGVCGKASIDQISVTCTPISSPLSIPGATILGLPDVLRRGQRTFDRTGGLHASGLFTAAGELIELREDVGRHNALDKLIGNRLTARAIPAADGVVLVSGRASFELVQKAAVAGVPVLCAVGAPSSLAVEAADRLGVTLVGFVRDDRLNVYTHAARVELEARASA